jgi:AraC family transcriptional regulator
MIQTLEHDSSTMTIGTPVPVHPAFTHLPHSMAGQPQQALSLDGVRIMLFSQTTPRSFVIDPDGDYILIARMNHRSKLRYDLGKGPRAYEILCGHVLVRPAREESRWWLQKPDQTVVMRISEQALRGAWENDSDELWPGLISMETFRQDSLLAQAIGRLYAEIQRVRFVNQMYIRTLLFQLITDLVRRYSEPVNASLGNPGLSPLRLRKVLSYIMEHLDSDLALTKLAEVAGVSHYYFCREFKKSMGITPQCYVMNQRIERAKALLKNDSFSITEISQQLYFSTPSHFTATFRKLVGITPRSFRVL